MNIIWEENTYRNETYQGYCESNWEVRVKKVGDNISLHWAKWVFYTIVQYDSIEEYENGEENYDMEEFCYTGLEEDIPHYHELNWKGTPSDNEGVVYQIHPRRFAFVMLDNEGNPNWDTWDNGESYVDSTWVVQNGTLVPLES